MMLNETTTTVCTHTTDRVHTPTHTTHTSDRVHTPTHTPEHTETRTVLYWNDGSLYWLPDGEEARNAERFEMYGTTYYEKVPNDWTDEQITAHLQTVCTHPRTLKA